MNKLIDVIAVVLVIIAALNYGLGVFGLDILYMIFGTMHWLNALVQIVIGLSGVYLIFRCPKMCKSGHCSTKKDSSSSDHVHQQQAQQHHQPQQHTPPHHHGNDNQ